jgi:dihydropyrimidinase
MRTLIRGGTVVTASDTFGADLFVEDGTVGRVAESIALDADRTIDATGMYVMPGGIDAHTHLDMPLGDITSADDFESGTTAAAVGGTTTVIDFATQRRGGTLQQALDEWTARAEGKAVIDYGFHLAITDLRAETEREMDAMVASGVSSFKLYMAYPGTLMVDDGSIFRAMTRSRENGATIAIHAENGGVIEALVRQALAQGHTTPKWHALTRPAGAEGEATVRAIALAGLAGAPVYIVHLSAAVAVTAVAEARARGAMVLAETCPQYLLLSGERYDEPGFDAAKYVMSPPLRTRQDQECLWRALVTGDIQVVATDHCPFLLEHKARGRNDFTRIPNGAPGIEHRLSLLFDAGVRSGSLSLNRFVELVSTAPARIFGLFPRKGTIAAGADADIVIFDPSKRVTISAATHHMRVDYDPYEGRQVVGAAQTVLSRGEIVVDQGRFVGRRGHGQFLRRAPRVA